MLSLTTALSVILALGSAVPVAATPAAADGVVHVATGPTPSPAPRASGKRPKIKVVLRTPVGVAATVNLRKGKMRVVVAKSPQGRRTTSVRKVAPGKWKVIAEPVLVNGQYYAPKRKRTKVRAAKGKTRKVVVKYRLVKRLATGPEVSRLTADRVAAQWQAPKRKDKVVVRRTVGTKPAAGRKAGRAVNVKARTSFADNAAVAGTTYTYAIFTKRKKQWLRSAVLGVSTPTRNNAGTSLRYVAAPSAHLPQPNQILAGENRSGGRFAIRLRDIVPVIGETILVPRSPTAPYGFLGMVSAIEADGTVVLDQAPLEAAFDVLDMEVPQTGLAARPGMRPSARPFFEKWGSFSTDGCETPVADKEPTRSDKIDVDLGHAVVMDKTHLSLKKKEVKYFPDIPYGFDLDGGVQLAASLSFGISLDASKKCAWDTAPLPIPVGGPLPLTLVLEGHITLEAQGGVAVTGAGFEVSIKQPFDLNLNVVDPSQSDLGDAETVFDLNPLYPSAEIGGSLTAKVGVAVTVGFGGGQKPVGAVAGIEGTLDPLAISVSATGNSTVGAGQDACAEVKVGGEISLALVGRAWLGGKDFEKKFVIPPSPLTWNWLEYLPGEPELKWCVVGPPQIKTRQLPGAEVDLDYSAQLELAEERSGTWSVSAGGLPDGLALDPDSGLISGVPTLAGVTTFSVKFDEDSTDDGDVSEREFTLSVKPPPPPPRITTAYLDEGVVGYQYLDQMRIWDGREGTWSVTAGALPAGLDLGADGFIAGRPEAVGESTLTVTFTDARGMTGEREFDIVVHPNLTCAGEGECVSVGGTVWADGALSGIAVTLVSPWGDHVVTGTTDENGRFLLKGQPISDEIAYTVAADAPPELEDRCTYWSRDPDAYKDKTTEDLGAAGLTDTTLRLRWSSARGDCGPPGGGGSQGDPHLTTFDGARYDFHAQGEYVAARSTVDDFEVHFQFRRPVNARVSWNGGAAARVGESIIVFGDADPHSSQGQLVATLDGVVLDLDSEPTTLPGDVSAVRTQRAVTLTWPDGTVLVISDDGTRNNSTTYTLSPSESRRGTLEGLLGNADGNRANDVVHADGTPVKVYSPDDLYGDFADLWEVPEDLSWFSSPLPHVRPGETVTLASLDPSLVAAARDACVAAGVALPAALERCTFDVAVSGDESYAPMYLAAEDDLDGTVDASILTSGTYKGRLNSGGRPQANFAAGQVIEYRLDLRLGETVQLTVIDCAQVETLQVALVAPSGQVVAQAEGEGCGRLVVDSAPEPGTYHLRISDSGGYAGSVRLAYFSMLRPPLASSQPGDGWTSASGSGLAVNAANQKECSALDGFGNCVAGANWPAIPGAQWIWTAAQPGGESAASFTKAVVLPGEESRSCTLEYGADGTSVSATLNGAALSVSPHWNGDTDKITVILEPGANELTFAVDNGVSPTANNPGGLIWKISGCAEQARIESVSNFVSDQPIVISGTGFGPTPAFSNETSAYLKLAEPNDQTPGYWQACGKNAQVGCDVWWSGDGTSITVNGFDRDYGTGRWSFEDGDTVTITVLNTFGGGYDECVVVVGAGPTDCSG